MAWRDNLQLDGKGSFRKIEFYVDSVESTIGRRTSLHEFPGSDHVEVEDLGRATRRFTFNAYVLGPDYMDARDKLRSAFENPGPGPLVHPYWGKMDVTVDGQVRLRESVSEGGMARFTLNVIRVTETISRIVKLDTKVKVEAAADIANVALAEDFEDDWTISGVIEAVRDFAQALINGVNSVVSVLNKLNGYANAAMLLIDQVGDAITALSAAAATLILLPSTLASRIQGLVADVIGAVNRIEDALGAYHGDDEVAGTPLTSPAGGTPASGDQRGEILMSMFRDSIAYGSGFATVNETTPQREAQATNQSAMIAFFRGSSVIEACRAVAGIPFSSYGAAVAIRDEISDALDALADVANDITYGALTDLRAEVVRHLTEASADLPRVITYTPARALPALVIAQRLYGDSTRDTDIIERNNVRNPCRVPGGAALEVLSSE